MLRAREILGFEPDEPLTRELVEQRRRKLAKVFHPDADPKTQRHMQRINGAASQLLAKYR